MLLTVSSAGWRLPSSDIRFQETSNLRPESHLELTWIAGASEDALTEVWASLYFAEPEPVQKLLMYRMDARDLEWTFEFRGAYDSLTTVMAWNGIQEDTGEVTLIKKGVPEDLLEEIGAERAA